MAESRSRGRPLAVITGGTVAAADPMPQLEDDDLMRLVSQDDQAAFRVIVRRHERGVRAYCGHTLGDGSLADDVAQEVFLDLWRGRARYVGRGKLAAYLCVVARHRCEDVRRRKRDGRVAGLDSHGPSVSPDQVHEPEPVFGLSHADELRMRHYLTAIADEERSLRLTKGVTNLVVGGLFVGSGLYMYAASSQFALTSGERLGYLAGFSSIGLLFAVPGVLALGTTSPGEQGLATFERELRVPGASRANVVARTEEALDVIAQRDRFERKFWRWTGALTSGLALTMGTVALARGETNTPAGRDYVAAMYGTGALLGGMTVALFFTPDTRSSRLLRLYRTDPDLETGSSLQVGMAPLPGGGAIGLSGRF